MKISKKRSYNTKYILKPKYEQSRWIIAIFFCILLFVFIFFPVFGLNWRYQIGGIFSTFIDGLGMFCLTIGGFFMFIGFIGIFTRNSHSVRNIIIGVTLLWIGCWCTGAVLNLLGITIGDTTSSGGSGYH